MSTTTRLWLRPRSGAILQRNCACGGRCPKCAKAPALRRNAAGAAPNHAPAIVHEVLNSPGRPMEPGARATMEPRFGHDFSAVRVHSDAKAAESARAVGALAYTVGRHVVFGEDASISDKNRLMAHELTHVVQQRAADG